MQLQDLQQRALQLRQLYAEFEQKKYGREWTREELVQGFVVDVGELVELSMAKNGIRNQDNLDEKITHELADCFWSVLVLAEKYNVDLEKAFLETSEKLETSLRAE